MALARWNHIFAWQGLALVLISESALKPLQIEQQRRRGERNQCLSKLPCPTRSLQLMLLD
eukprot:scaffold10510_cov84-Skeletonema_dohrnii-CCMP3373.AAC.2